MPGADKGRVLGIYWAPIIPCTQAPLQGDNVARSTTYAPSGHHQGAMVGEEEASVRERLVAGTRCIRCPHSTAPSTPHFPPSDRLVLMVCLLGAVGVDYKHTPT